MKEDDKREFFQLKHFEWFKQYKFIIGPRSARIKERKERINGKEKR